MAMREDMGDVSGAFDLADIEEMDPSIADGFHPIYDREVPFEIRIQGPDGQQQTGTIEALKCKILLLGDDEAPQALRMELSSEADLFFHYMHYTDEAGFATVQQQQKLMIDFPDYASVLIRMLNNCIREHHTHLAVFTMFGESSARLDFIQNMEYKFVDLMALNFTRSQEEIVQHHITYRYNALKQRYNLCQKRLQEMSNLMKSKNPVLASTSATLSPSASQTQRSKRR